MRWHTHKVVRSIGKEIKSLNRIPQQIMLIWGLFYAWVLVLNAIVAAEFEPKVTRTGESSIFLVLAFDDSTTLLQVRASGMFISFDNGDNWQEADGVPTDITWAAIDDYNRKDRAIATTKGGEFYITDDQGKHWRYLQLPEDAKNYEFCEIETHPFKRNYLLIRCTKCPEWDTLFGLEGNVRKTKRTMFMPSCQYSSFVSNNGGKAFKRINSPKHESSPDTEYLGVTCEFVSKSTGTSLSKNKDLIYCMDSKMDAWFDDTMAFQTRGVLFYTIDFGKTSKMIDQFKDLTVSDFQILDSHILVYTLEDRFNRKSAANLWVSKDGFNFKKAFLPTILRSTQAIDPIEDDLGRIILPLESLVENSDGASQILISDSSSLQFHALEVVPEDLLGFTTLSISKNLKGTMLANFISISNYLRHSNNHLYQGSKISLDNGNTWSNLKLVESARYPKKSFPCDISDVEHCSLRTFFSEPISTNTAGILMTVGNVGDGTGDMFENLMTFISRDGGATWEIAFQYPCAFAFGDLGNLIVVMPFFPDEDNDPQGEFYYSLDQGKTWKEYQLSVPITPMELISTTPDGSGLKFIISSFNLDRRSNDSPESFFYTIDFSEAFNREVCGPKDLETWYLANGECVNGVKYSYNRRKQDSQCFVRKLFKDLDMKEEICDQCTDKDYECSFGFHRSLVSDKHVCMPDFKRVSFSPECVKSNKNNVKLKPMTKLAGNKCRKELKIESVEVPCGAGHDGPVVTENNFKSQIQLYQYFDTNQDETLIISTVNDGVYISHDSGQTVKRFDPGEPIVEIVFNAYHDSFAYLFGASGRLYVTGDRCRSFEVTELPYSKQLGFPLEFHATNPDTFIYYGGRNCEDLFNPSCQPVAYITTDSGQSFTELLDNAFHCEFVGSIFKHPVDENLIYCQVKDPGTRKRSLVSSIDMFHNDRQVQFDKIIGYMSTGEFIVVAVPYGKHDRELRAYVTVDGSEFAEARFPWDLSANEQEAFTVLGSETGAIFLHLTTYDKPGGEYGVLLKSNSNGTSFVKLKEAVNRNLYGMVDFEKVQELEGIILINVVDDFKHEVESNKKRLKSMITFNDGSDWSYIKAPSKDSEGKSYGCNTKQLEKCSLHLHGFTERQDVRDTFFSGSAFGMLIGVGNVGEYLLPEDQCSTFFSKDGGETWREIKKGAFQWEFGDHGGIIILVPKNTLTDSFHYSLTMGEYWESYTFTGEKVYIQDIVTVPGDSALRFLLIGSSMSVTGGSTKAFTVDFYNAFDRQCLLDRDRPNDDDFRFCPLRQSGSECLFGHQAEYLMKDNVDCFVGNAPLSEFLRITKNCSCTRADFECDYNYLKAWDGTCKLAEGLSPSDPSGICKREPGLIEYFQPTGYRKIPLSTCVGGLKLDAVSSPSPCPGKEKEFKELHGISSGPYFFTFVTIFLVLLSITWFIYDRGIRRNGGFARFGEIRLDGDDLIENNNADKLVNSIVRTGFYVTSAIFSSYQLLKRATARTLWKLSERFGTRRGPTYSSLLNDQFLDDADDLLTGHDEDANDLGNFLENQGNFEIEDDDNEFPREAQTFDRGSPVKSTEQAEFLSASEVPRTSEPTERSPPSSSQELNNDEVASDEATGIALGIQQSPEK